jgi:hypothetical protein
MAVYFILHITYFGSVYCTQSLTCVHGLERKNTSDNEVQPERRCVVCRWSHGAMRESSRGRTFIADFFTCVADAQPGLRCRIVPKGFVCRAVKCCHPGPKLSMCLLELVTLSGARVVGTPPPCIHSLLVFLCNGRFTNLQQGSHDMLSLCRCTQGTTVQFRELRSRPGTGQHAPAPPPGLTLATT